ncbi:MAG TPA: hypothetical protein VGA04_20780 [Streptosporangiaceae bacterium]
MPYYWVAGEIPAKRRVCFRGRLAGHQAGELRGDEGFPLLARHFRITDRPRGGYLALGRRLLFANDDVRISVVTAGDTVGLYRNSTRAETISPQNGALWLKPVYSCSKWALVIMSWLPAAAIPSSAAQSAG